MTVVIDKLRHPEKAHRPDSAIQRKPDWIRVKAPVSREYAATREVVRANKLHTVCEEAACPNIGECWTKRHATMMIMGDTCTRAPGQIQDLDLLVSGLEVAAREIVAIELLQHDGPVEREQDLVAAQIVRKLLGAVHLECLVVELEGALRLAGVQGAAGLFGPIGMTGAAPEGEKGGGDQRGGAPAQGHERVTSRWLWSGCSCAGTGWRRSRRRAPARTGNTARAALRLAARRR